MKKHLVMAVVPFLALGCGDDFKDENGDGIADGIREPDSVTVVTPATPKGTVSGQVLTSDLKPLSEASVEITIGSSADPLAGTTDAKGNFEFKDVPAGSQVLLTFTKAGFATLRATSTIPSSAGNVPINNANVSFGPVTLTRLDGTLRFLLVTPSGRPAANVKATLEAAPAGAIILANNDTNITRVVSAVVVEATSDEQGVATFQGIPGAVELARYTGSSYRLWVSAVDSNGDGIPESNGYVNTYAATTIITASTTNVVNLPATANSADPLSIEGSNVGSLRFASSPDPLRNFVKPSEPIYLYFNKPVQQGSLLVRLTDEFAKESLPVTVSLGNGGFSATVTPANGAVQEGKEYNVHVHAVSAENGSILSEKGFFFGGDPSTPRPVTITEVRYQETSLVGQPGVNVLNAGEKVYVTFSSPISTANAPVYVFLNRELNTPLRIGDVAGEENNAVGFALTREEPTRPIQSRIPAELPVFDIEVSNFSTRYSFIYSGVDIADVSNFPLRLAFGTLQQRTLDVYQSIWRQPLSTDLVSTSLGILPAPIVVP